MCGVCGVWQRPGASHEALEQLATNMATRLRHRGPNDGGTFTDAEVGIALGHRRLAVVDLSPLGHQPMGSASGRYVISYNGEIYNHRQLRDELVARGYPFQGHSDTEVILGAIEQWGLDGSLHRFIGMFAFALWDRRERTLSLARDRLGIKPLYYGWIGSQFVFASELKALALLPGFSRTINRDALSLLLSHGYIRAPHSIYQGIYKLPPGTWLSIDQSMAASPSSATTLMGHFVPYWSARDAAEAGTSQRLDLRDSEAIDALDRLLRDAVGLRMEADVPLGAFLSGGIDSSTVVALMQAQSIRPVKTFSIGFQEHTFDEAPHAKAVAEHLGTEHHELYVTARDALDVVPQLTEIFDEPFADASQIPTFLLSKLARSQVTVSLTGDGGDELFGGYSRYFEAERIRRWMSPLPFSLRQGAARWLNANDVPASRVLGHINQFLPARMRPKNPLTATNTLAALLNARTVEERYHQLTTYWGDASHVVNGCREAPDHDSDPSWQAKLGDPMERMMYADLMSYLPDNCLVKVDRASMAASLEARVPLLDHRIVEFAWRLPVRQKIRGKDGKWLLRQVLHRYVPKALVDRPKMGFGVPIGDWLRGPLREWAESLLDAQRLREEGYFDPGSIRDVWAKHLSGKASEPQKLWNVLMFQAWLEHGGKTPSS
ncbi:MAG: asparagine synthase (glutamine-hydrolyzing) [Rhodanobacter sp.]